MEILRAFLQDQGIFPVREELLVQLVTSLTDKENTDQWLHRTFEMLLDQDISNIMNGGTLPYQLSLVANGIIHGKYLVQLEDVIDIASDEPRKERANGTLKCTFFDGQQQVYGLELTDMKHCLSVHSAPGTKFLLHDPLVHRGIVLLTRNNCVCLGGVVVDVQKKRDSLLTEIMQKAMYRVKGFEQPSQSEGGVDNNSRDEQLIPIGQGISNFDDHEEEEEEDD